MSYFKGANNVTPQVKFPPFPSGFQGRCRVERSLNINPRGGKPPAYIVEFTVISSNMEEVKVGMKHSWYQKLIPGDDTGLKACAGLLYAVIGKNMLESADKAYLDEHILPRQEALLNESVEKNTFAGKVVELATHTTVTDKGKGHPFTVHTFAPVKQSAAA